ncbi:glycoside hydrolase [Russula brevipes]|nr:glycoside hydrolase [Russula brevipes]
MASTYRNVDTPAEPYQWQEKYSSGRGRRKWLIWGGVIAVLAVIAIGVGVGVSVSNKNKNNTSNKSSNNPNSPTTSASPVPQTDPNDPSTFIKDPRLKQSFYAMAYTPDGSIPPNCSISLSGVIEDIQLISQLTTRLRLYGSECNQSAMVLEAIKQTKVNMQVFLGNYIEPDDNGTSYTRQRDVIVNVLKTYGVDNILGVTVGNEFMLNYLTAHGSADPNSAVGNQGAQQLVPYIQDMVKTLAALNLAKHLPVGNSDAGAFFNTQVLEAVEFGMANVHPWFGNVSIDLAAGWTYQFFEEQNVAAAAALSNRPTMYIAETGWPSASSDAGNANNGASAASIANLQTFLDTYVCQASKNNTGYFYFEVFDEQWKDVLYGGVEGHWGLFNKDKSLKNITIPTCS